MTEETYTKPTHVDGHDTPKESGGVDFENPPVVITFTDEQQQELKGTILEGSRGLRLSQKNSQLVAEQLA